MFIFIGWYDRRNRYGASFAINTDEGEITSEAMLSLTGFWMLSEYLDANLHAGSAGMIDLSPNNNDVTDAYRALKDQIIYSNRDTRLSAMS